MAMRIRTTHVGSLPRPPKLATQVIRQEHDQPIDTAELDGMVATAVHDAVAHQREAGIDIINDGEMSKVSYATYLSRRCTGIVRSSEILKPGPLFASKYPGFSKTLNERFEQMAIATYECNGPIAVKDMAPLTTDLRNLRTAAAVNGVSELFMSAASPGIISGFIRNKYYPTHEAYLAAIAEAMRVEYEAIAEAGITLQLDCPDLSGRPGPDETAADVEARKMLAVEAINEATKNIDPQRLRLHLCFGNLEAPHDDDLSLDEVLPFACRARPATILFEASNPRHAHEWAIFDDFPFPDDKSIAPGVIDSTTNFVEHPHLIAQRIQRFVKRLGAERVIAGADCGFGTHALANAVDTDVVYAKLRALADGAELASSGTFIGSAHTT
jgi:5-methyltetrahydropteroyltriglutamate--homocysteine methyltransferase